MHIAELQTPRHGADVGFLAELHHAEFGGKREFNVKAVIAASYNFMQDKQREQVNCWIAYDVDEPVGYLAATIHHSLYSFRSYAVQEMWYVIPKYRSGRAAIGLLNAFERWARHNKCERIYAQVEHDDNATLVERIFTLLQFLGYKKQGYVAVKETNIKLEDNKDDPGTRRTMGARQAQG